MRAAGVQVSRSEAVKIAVNECLCVPGAGEQIGRVVVGGAKLLRSFVAIDCAVARRPEPRSAVASPFDEAPDSASSASATSTAVSSATAFALFFGGALRFAALEAVAFFFVAVAGTERFLIGLRVAKATTPVRVS